VSELIEVKFNIGGFIIALKNVKDQGIFDIDERYRKFITSDETQIFLNVFYGQLPDFERWSLIFDSGGVWKLYQRDGHWGIGFYSHALESGLFQAAIFEHDFYSGDIILPNSDKKIKSNPFPYTYPLPEVHMMNLLSQGNGVLVHACAVKDGDRGLLFAGTSGAGKSTTAELWSSQGNTAILSDDRVIIRKHEGQFWIYGTPWHGTARCGSPEAVPLTRIYILKQAPRNQLRALKPIDAHARILVRSFPTYWNYAGIDFTLGFLDELVQEVPCYELGFVPEDSVVDFVRCQIYV
jgi:hypothetical protein